MGQGERCLCRGHMALTLDVLAPDTSVHMTELWTVWAHKYTRKSIVCHRMH